MIYLLLADGFEETEALCPLDILRRAGLSVQTVSVRDRHVLGSHGITVLADITADEAVETPELLILPGGMPGALHLDQAACTDTLLKKTLANGGRVAAICAAPFILGKRGLLEGKHAICYPGFEKELKGAILSDLPCVTDGKITTAIGMGAATEFGLELAALMTTKDKADDIARAIHYKQA